MRVLVRFKAVVEAPTIAEAVAVAANDIAVAPDNHLESMAALKMAEFPDPAID